MVLISCKKEAEVMNLVEYVAHINEKKEEQSVSEHCRNTAVYAAACLEEAGLENTGYLAGLIHDMGKAKAEFNDYIHASAAGENPVRGSVNHTFAGCRYMLEQFHSERENSPYIKLTAELIAYAAGAHHGLFDVIDENYQSGFRHRIEKEKTGYEESVKNYLAHVSGPEEIRDLFDRAVREIIPIAERLIEISGNQAESNNRYERDFYFGMLARLVLSAVIEGDRRDTAEFFREIRYPSYSKEALCTIWKQTLEHVESELRLMPAETEIQKARSEISQICKAFAVREGGVFRLNVPTGGGKTLSSLRFALAHVKHCEKSKIIFTSPLLSILDQNAKVIRDFVKDDSIILEHHSNIVNEEVDLKSGDASTDDEKLNKRELMTENWNAPVIITTMVQLLNTMFSGKTGCIRRFSALCGSVIVIDEVQTVPVKMLTEFNLAVNFLSEICGATVVLCSATQPCLESVPHSLFRKPEDMVPYNQKLWKAFQRTEIKNAGAMDMPGIASFAGDLLKETDSVLIICNKKSEAAELFRYLSENDNYNVFHLSASMCMSHRENVLQELRTSLCQVPEAGRKTACVATQVMEAGIDISFGRVIRFVAGLDSIVQAAGRCNRNGESAEPAPVYIVDCLGENMNGLKDIANAQAASRSLLTEFENEPERFGCSLTSDDAVSFYYRTLYNNLKKEYMDFIVPEGKSLFSLLSFNNAYNQAGLFQDCGRYILTQSFRKAGSLFSVFDSDTYDILVPYERGKEIIAELQSEQASYNQDLQIRLIEEAKKYTVSVYSGNLRSLEKEGGIYSVCEGSVIILKDNFYDQDLGYVKKGAASFDYLEV
ncbi:MAG: CRISPR-associated helicase Cas3' [Anaerovoracaceae bacterium]